jgi:hypothetical protein
MQIWKFEEIKIMLIHAYLVRKIIFQHQDILLTLPFLFKKITSMLRHSGICSNLVSGILGPKIEFNNVHIMTKMNLEARVQYSSLLRPKIHIKFNLLDVYP